ncbi:MAG: hypothetical protein RR619_07685, partial [Raoultibacter sp.]
GFAILGFAAFGLEAFDVCFCDAFAAFAGAVFIEGRDLDDVFATALAGAFADGFDVDLAVDFVG